MTEGGFTMSGGAQIAADGTFETETPGGPVEHRRRSRCPTGWTVKSIHLDRVDVDGQTVDMSGGTRQLQIVLTDHANSVSGMVVDRNGRTLPGLFGGALLRGRDAVDAVVAVHHVGAVQPDRSVPPEGRAGRRLLRRGAAGPAVPRVDEP